MTTADQGSGAAVGMFENRLRKNARHLRKWARARGLSAFRVYDRDGERCVTPGCRGTIARVWQAGRSTFYCPVCQK